MNRIVACLGSLAFLAAADAAQMSTTLTWEVVDNAGTTNTRTALVYYPATPQGTVVSNSPVIFAFHGANNRVDGFKDLIHLHEEWPEAVVVYPQGLDRVLPDETIETRRWQGNIGKDNDRDLHLFDAMLGTMTADYNTDTNKVFGFGFSNGAVFLYLLMHERGDSFTAYCPANCPDTYSGSKPLVRRPAIMLDGENDEYHTYTQYQMGVTLSRNGCTLGSSPWSAGPDYGLYYPSTAGAPCVTYIHPYGHVLLDYESHLVITFFKQQLPAETGAPAPAGTNSIYDDFENGVLSSGGSGTTNAGFKLVDNGYAEAIITSDELDGAGSVTLTNAKVCFGGLVSLNSINATENPEQGMTATWVVPALIAGYKELNFTLQSGDGLFAETPCFSFTAAWSSGYSINVSDGIVRQSVATGGTATQINGFTLTAAVNAAGWTVDSDGLGVHASGAWPAGFTYADLFDDSTHIGAFVKTATASSGPTRNIKLSSATVVSGADPLPPPPPPPPPTTVSYLALNENFNGYADGTRSTDNKGADILGDGWYTTDESATITDTNKGTLVYQSLNGDGYLKMGGANTIYCLKPLDTSITSTVTKVVMTGKYNMWSYDLYIGLHNATPVPPPGTATFTFDNKKGTVDGVTNNFIRIGGQASNQILLNTQNVVIDFVFTLEQSGGPGTDVIGTLSYQTNGTGFIEVTFGSGAAETNIHSFGSVNSLASIKAAYLRHAYGGGFADLKVEASYPAEPGPDTVGSFEPISGGNQIRMGFNGANVGYSYVWYTTNLATGVWMMAPISDDGINAFIPTNLSYSSTTDGTNHAVYVEQTEKAAFYRIGPE